VPAVVGLAVLRRLRFKGRRGNEPVVIEAALLGDVDPRRGLPPVGVGPEVAERLHGIHVEPEARSDGGERGRLFQHQRLDAGFPEGDCRSKPAGAAPGDDHAHCNPLSQLKNHHKKQQEDPERKRLTWEE
jgi:hypothetical protein